MKIDWWFFDESRYGQQGNLYHIWAETNTRPQRIKQMEFESCHLIGAVNPANGDKVGLIFSTLDTDVTNLFFKELEAAIPENHHAILVLDGAGFHRGAGLKIPKNVTLRFLPPYSPELNPIERLWKWLKEHYLGNTVSRGLNELFERGLHAWEKVSAELVQSLCFVDWSTT